MIVIQCFRKHAWYCPTLKGALPGSGRTEEAPLTKWHLNWELKDKMVSPGKRTTAQWGPGSRGSWCGWSGRGRKGSHGQREPERWEHCTHTSRSFFPSWSYGKPLQGLSRRNIIRFVFKSSLQCWPRDPAELVRLHREGLWACVQIRGQGGIRPCILTRIFEFYQLEVRILLLTIKGCCKTQRTKSR